MRARKWWALGTAVVLGWSTALATADEDGTPGRRPVVRPNERPGIIDKVLDLGRDTTDKKSDKNAKDTVRRTDKAGADAPKPNLSPAASALAREQAAFQRRVAVCDRLREIAIESNNSELDQLAQELNARAWAVYKQRTAKLEAAPKEKDQDEQILDKKLGIDLGPEDTKPVLKSESKRIKNERSQAETREDDR